MVFTGPMHRHVAKYKSYLNKRNVVNPARGAFHYKEPSKYFRKVFRNMACRRTVRGNEAANRIFVYEGIPKQFENVERTMVPKAHRKLTTDPDRKYIYLGALLSQFGWQYAELCDQLKQDIQAREAQAKAFAKEKAEKISKVTSSSDFKNEVQRRMAEFA
ncbi:ribosomal protein L13 [Vittaforma corneae ATCC 50505]|uniref:Ribosomal protein L13 n=1 Tax=Vittaforma corneae (strain ATCC 50505) TaxID=993615 RepID=L2GNJ6_VITCO|nr:ribosomal protein L13 [Vittaforma corneae ATCC 50505]ELA42179.1 ribosomal protein L13 [Vittaforma corneae ATCC 50505]